MLDTIRGKLRADEEMLAAGWRIEVLANGKYWQWRKGRGKDRIARYGGRFSELSEDRRNAYEKNKTTHAR